ncbi:MAG: hypothetical protein H0U20_02350 [Thermoleophilaceae bacterium]|nr:hypothetical protein [Thermoleophilaceae bacterium]
MLFDLGGKRRRAVQATYLMLAVLMGGGLVLFGIGGDVSFNVFDDAGGGGNDNSAGNEIVQKRVERSEARVRANPQDEAARKDLVRGYYQLATSQTTDGAVGFPKEAQDELRKSAANWQAYLKAEPAKPDASLARLVLQLYGPDALKKPKEAQEAAALIARVDNDTNSYLNLIQYAALASDTRTANLAATKAVDLAPKSERKAVKAQAEQLKQPPSAAGGQAPASGAQAPADGSATGE